MKADGLPDNRVTCATCARVILKARRCSKLRIGVVIDMPLRCVAYMPDHIERDRTPGRDRWPELAREIAEARAACPDLDRKPKPYLGDLESPESLAGKIGGG